MNATIFGRIGRDAETKETQGGTVIARVSVALNVYDKKERLTTWVNATLFGKQAETLAQYLTKGSSVAMTGDLKLRTYESTDGTQKTTLDMNVQAVALLGAGSGEQTEQARPATRAASAGARPAASTSKGGYKPAARPTTAQSEPEDEDPF